MLKYNKDPRCEKLIKKGDNIIYYPNGNRILCSVDECGGHASRDFDAAAVDEEFMGG